MSPAALLARAIASRDCLPPPIVAQSPAPAACKPDPPAPGRVPCIDGCGRTVRRRPDRSGRCIACRRARQVAGPNGPSRVACPGGCGRTIHRKGGLCRACWDASPAKRAQASAAARANPTPGGHPAPSAAKDRA